uniref:Uncharacterized protein n=1 Tax=Dicentrarchus labrax TaxID=13489 RepID=A0A8C4H286_DICLA
MVLLPLLLVLAVSARSRLWICSSFDWLKLFPQVTQMNGRSPVCSRWCERRSSALVKPLGQWAHTYGFWPVWMSWSRCGARPCGWTPGRCAAGGRPCWILWCSSTAGPHGGRTLCSPECPSPAAQTEQVSRKPGNTFILKFKQITDWMLGYHNNHHQQPIIPITIENHELLITGIIICV